jgi:hypothetical protein
VHTVSTPDDGQLPKNILTSNSFYKSDFSPSIWKKNLKTENITDMKLSWVMALSNLARQPLQADFLLGWFFILKMGVICSSETSVHIQTTWLYIPGGNVQNICCVKSKVNLSPQQASEAYKVVGCWGSHILKSLGRAVLSRNVIYLLLVLISVRDWVNPRT